MNRRHIVAAILRILLLPLLLAFLALLVACQMEGNGTAMPAEDGMQATPMEEEPTMGEGLTGDGMGNGTGGALGGTAETMLLAEQLLDRLPDGRLAWVGYAFDRDAVAEPITHAHAPGFIYVPEGEETVVVDGQEQRLQAGEGYPLGENVEHTHREEGPYWEILLVKPEQTSETMAQGDRQFASPPLEGIPDPPVMVRFILVELPPGSQTSIHTHPGSEYIYVTEGQILYENARVGVEPMGAGDDHALPAGVAVQKRNPDGAPATFLSFFIVDPARPFATEASFE